jgi:hypothetical protein
MTEVELLLAAGESLRKAGKQVTPANVEAWVRSRMATQQRSRTLGGAVLSLNAACAKLAAATEALPKAPGLAEEVRRELAKPEHAGKFIARVNEQSGDVQTYALPVRYDEKTK